MPLYTNTELADIHFMYGKADGNAELARQLYREKYPQRRVPCNRVFSGVHQQLRDNGSFSINVRNRDRSIRTNNVEEVVIQQAIDDPSTSVRRIARRTNISKSTVFRILKDEG